MPKRTQGLLMGMASLLLGPIVTAATVLRAVAAPVAGSSATRDMVERTGRSVLSVSHVVADRADDPGSASAGPPLLTAAAPSAAATPVPAVIAVPLVVAPTPRPPVRVSPAPSPDRQPPPSPGSIQQIIIDAAARHGVNGAWMVRIARCESGLNPRALNPAGPWIGLFQFAPATFRGHGGKDIYNASQQADIAARMLAAGQAHQWPVCSLS